MRANYELDVRHVLPAIQAPTLILHRVGDNAIPVAAGRFLAQNIRGAKYVELPGEDHMLQAFDTPLLDRLCDEIEEFVTGARSAPDLDRMLLSVLFVDIVESTQRAASLGDRRWRELLEGYLGAARKQLERFRGREVDVAGDGVFATFDGPARAIRCAVAIRDAVQPLGLEVRAGVHTGECEIAGAKVTGIAVHTGSRVATAAKPQEVLVTATVKDLVAGSGLTFEDAGEHELKGVPDRWRLYRVAS
jgi:class 3 adenylate cyclase